MNPAKILEVSQSSSLQQGRVHPAGQPAEWEPHRACWVAWPSAAHLWKENLESAQNEFVDLCRVIADLDDFGVRRGELLEVLVSDETALEVAKTRLRGLGARFSVIPYGDIWLRDTAPVFVRKSSGEVEAARFAFNGWGGKYALPHDRELAERIATASELNQRSFDWILEGGSVEVDGQGTLLTTRQCLLNPNRNAGVAESLVEKRLEESLGAKKVIWLDEGLENDHTDGHVDTLARFAGPGVVICMEARSTDDPNAEVLSQIQRTLRSATDAQGRALQVVTVPSPGRVTDCDGNGMAASYVNFYIANTTVIVPTYGTPYDQEAVTRIAQWFPERRTVGLSARAILSGGGAFHCITQQEPSSVLPTSGLKQFHGHRIHGYR